MCRLLAGQHGGVDLEVVRNVAVHVAPNAPTLPDHPVTAVAFTFVDDIERTADADVQRPMRRKSSRQIRSYYRTQQHVVDDLVEAFSSTGRPVLVDSAGETLAPELPARHPSRPRHRLWQLTR